MKKPAEKEIKNLIRKFRLVCDELNDCPVKKARTPSQLDCVSCILQDVEAMRSELNSLRELREKIASLTPKTPYGETITKLECAIDESMLPKLRKRREMSTREPRTL